MTCEERPASAVAQPTRVGPAEVRDIVGALRRFGVEVDPAARRAGIDLAALAQGLAVEASAVVRLFREAERTSGDSLIGLHAAEVAEPSGSPAHLLMSCARLEDALSRCCRFGPVIVTTMRIDLERADDHFALVYDFADAEIDACQHVADYGLMATARALRRAVGPDAQFREVHLRHAEAGARPEFERAFGCRARFSQSQNRLLIPRSVAEREPRMSNPLIADQIEKFAAALLPGQSSPSTMAEQVANATRSLLNASVRADRRLVAKHLGVGERTLHRRLTEEGSSFRAVREAVLWDLAEALVSDHALKLEAVALSVGFGDAAAFSKAFKRRTGRSPNQYRHGLRARGIDTP
ncbi:MAG: AraC family transcriptional regulator [Deltaproteobacteria bacterium]|nr:AraC family transcriptional regulator [Deltaproteobacteria bacterium]